MIFIVRSLHVYFKKISFILACVNGDSTRKKEESFTTGNGAPSALQAIVILPPIGPRVCVGSGNRLKFGLNAENMKG